MDRAVELVYSKNGTVEIIQQDSSIPVVSLFITLFCLLFAVFHNLFVAAAVLSLERLRGSPPHQLLALVSLSCLMDCLCNETLAVGVLLGYPVSWCSLSAVFFHMFLLLHASSLAVLCVERTLAIYKRPLKIGTSTLEIILVIVIGLVFSLLLLVSSEVHYFPNRNSCGIEQRRSWPPALFLLVLLLSWTGVAVFLFVSLRGARPSSEQSPSYPRHHVSPCSRLLLLYGVLLLPQTLSVAVTLFLSPGYEPNPWLDPRDPAQVRAVRTHDLEPLLTYLRYMYNAAVPVAVLAADKAVRLRGRQIFCRKNHVSNDSSNFTTITTSTSPETELKTLKVPSYMTPVLFSTPQGIHLRVAQLTEGPGGSGAGERIRLITKFCDLTAEPRNSSAEYTCMNREDDRRYLKYEETTEDRRFHVQNRVRYLSKIEEVSAEETASGSGYFRSSSDTQTVLNPVVVRGEVHPIPEADRTYNVP